MTMGPELIFIIILAIWSLILTVLFLRFYLYYSRLNKHVENGDLTQSLNSLFTKAQDHEKALVLLHKQYAKLDESGKLHIQKVGLVRVNPFNDTGGDQSFILALVNAQDTGVVVSSLHTRTGTRWYAKAVVRGKGIEHELSAEEEKALKEAQNTIQ